MPTVEALFRLTQRLVELSDTPALDAQVLLAHVLGKPRAWVLARPEVSLTPEQQNTLDDAVTRLENYEPLPYVLGHWEFFGLDFIVTPDVLIPRPETELLVETAIEWSAFSTQRSKTLDIGTGSGCIAVSLAVHCPQADIVATDISAAALEVARRNAERHHVADRIQFVQADLLPPSTFNLQPATCNLPPATFDIIAANLPYIPTETLKSLPIYGHEPTLALDGGPDGLDLIRRLLADATRCLAEQGLLLLEIEASQGDSASRQARQAFPTAEIRLLPDLAGHDRLLTIRPLKADG